MLLEGDLNSVANFVAVGADFVANTMVRIGSSIAGFIGTVLIVRFREVGHIGCVIIEGDKGLSFLLDKQREGFVDKRKRVHQHNLGSNRGILFFQAF